MSDIPKIKEETIEISDFYPCTICNASFNCEIDLNEHANFHSNCVMEESSSSGKKRIRLSYKEDDSDYEEEKKPKVVKY